MLLVHGWAPRCTNVHCNVSCNCTTGNALQRSGSLRPLWGKRGLVLGGKKGIVDTLVLCGFAYMHLCTSNCHIWDFTMLLMLTQWFSAVTAQHVKRWLGPAFLFSLAFFLFFAGSACHRFGRIGRQPADGFGRKFFPPLVYHKIRF